MKEFILYIKKRHVPFCYPISDNLCISLIRLRYRATIRYRIVKI